jgi:hypothetical protein
VKQRIVELFCPNHLQDDTQRYIRKQNHIARIYLGRTSDTLRTAPIQVFTTYNFPLSRDRCDSLGLDTQQLSIEMGRLLARMHMSAHNDARDIEIVMGTDTTPRPNRDPSEVSFWMIDFNQVGDFDQTDEGIGKLVDSFFANDPYFPRARTNDPLYRHFANGYRKECEAVSVLAMHFGDTFLRKLEEEQVRRDSQRKDADSSID